MYAISSGLTTIIRFRAVLDTSANQATSSPADVLAGLRTKTDRLRQAITAAFYLFGFLLFLGLQASYNTLSLSRQPPVWEILANFTTHFAFAVNAFFMFLLIHLIQWGFSLWADWRYSRLNL